MDLLRRIGRRVAVEASLRWGDFRDSVWLDMNRHWFAGRRGATLAMLSAALVALRLTFVLPWWLVLVPVLAMPCILTLLALWIWWNDE